MKRIFAVALSFLSFVAVAAFAADSPAKLNGWISDAMCGAKHLVETFRAACAKKCIDGDQASVFVDEAKKEVWSIDNPESVKDAYGKHVTLTATADSATKSVHVTAVSVIAQ